MECLSLQEESLMNRFFAESNGQAQDPVRLTEEDARHALTVLRMKEGDLAEVVCLGRPWLAEIISTGSHGVLLRKLKPLPSTEPAISVTLFQGIPKADKMDWVVQKATEIGVSRVVPVIMERCVSKPDEHGIRRKLDRWRKISREAGKQSGRCVLPEICEPVPICDFPFIPLPETNVVPWEEAESFGPRAFYESRPSLSSLGILIGPEGGIAPDEVSLLKSLGFVPVTLGRLILRTESAGLAAVAAFFSLYGVMDRL